MMKLRALLILLVGLTACSDEPPPPPVVKELPAEVKKTQDSLEERANKVVDESVQIVNEASKKLAEHAKQELGQAVDKVAKETKQVLNESLSLPLSKEELLALAKKNGCLSCHALDKKSIGPTFQDIASKYHEHKHAQAKLIISISEGSSGKWGKAKMPANSPKVSDEHIEQLAAAILALSK